MDCKSKESKEEKEDCKSKEAKVDCKADEAKADCKLKEEKVVCKTNEAKVECKTKEAKTDCKTKETQIDKLKQNEVKPGFVKYDDYINYTSLRKGEFAEVVRASSPKDDAFRIIKFLDDNLYEMELELHKLNLEMIKKHLGPNENINNFNRFHRIIEHGIMDKFKRRCIVYEDFEYDLKKATKDVFIVKLRTINLFLYDSLCLINYLHNLGYVHRSIKPSTFMCHEPNHKRDFYLPLVITNLETCCKLISKEEAESNPEKANRSKVRNIKYCSINQHEDNQVYYPSDDIESWFYMGVYLFEAGLPWDRLNVKHTKSIIEKKKVLQNENDPFYNNTPAFFRRIIKNIINKYDKVDTDEIIHMLSKAANSFSKHYTVVV